jgi:hypothetical protein
MAAMPYRVVGGFRLPVAPAELTVEMPLLDSSRYGTLADVTDQSADFAAILAQVEQSRRGPEMAVRLRQSLEVTDALWELVPVAIAAGDAHGQRSAVDVADAAGSAKTLSPWQREHVRRLADTLHAATASALDEQPMDASALAELTAADVAADPFGIADRLMDTPLYLGRVVAQLGDSFTAQLAEMSAGEMGYFAAYAYALDQAPRAPVLLRALFAAAVSTVEPLVTRLVLLSLYDASPDVYTSLADPELDKQARDLCYGPPAKWRQALVNTLGITKLANLVDWDGLGLLWEARNVIAHRAGLVDARYQARSGDEIGSVLAWEPASVRSAIDEIGTARFAIAAGVWDHLMPGVGAQISDTVCIPLWDSLRQGRWRQACGLATVEEVLAGDEEAVATAKVHRWLALDQGHGPEMIRRDAEAWDVTGLPDHFRMARYLLLREDEAALAMVREFVAAGTISTQHLSSWPIFDRIREAGLLDDLMG